MGRKGPPRKPDTEVVEFDGVTYCRRPGKRYFKTNRWDPVAKRYYAVSLHQAIWRHHHGDIPPGHDVHHENGDYDDNSIYNLVCLPEGSHMRKHWQEWKTPEGQAVIDRMVAWTKTEEGRASMARRSRAAWQSVVERTHACERCGQEFKSKTLARIVKFCPGCRPLKRKACVVCGVEFLGVSQRKACKPECSTELRRRSARLRSGS